MVLRKIGKGWRGRVRPGMEWNSMVLRKIRHG
jgi:hypothetical protein